MSDILIGCLLGNGTLYSSGKFFIRLKESKKKYIHFLQKKNIRNTNKSNY